MSDDFDLEPQPLPGSKSGWRRFLPSWPRRVADSLDSPAERSRLAAGLRWLMVEIADRRAAQDLGASELTTLTFPPEPRVQRPRPSQLR